MSSRQNLYTGRSGQFAVMSQFLVRGYNVAMPEVDMGEDIFVVRDWDANLWRIQVKAAVGKGQQKVGGTFKVPLSQLNKKQDPELYYVFALYHNGLWREFVVFRRVTLRRLGNAQGLGHVAGKDRLLYLSFTDDDVQCSGVSLRQYRGDWSTWPVIRH
jgi:hypothetical protein